MRRKKVLTRTILALTFVLVFGGCDFLAGLFNPVIGTWTLYWDWDPPGSYKSGQIEFHGDGSFADGTYAGTWSLDGDSITFTYDGGTIYSGTLDSANGRMEGTMTSWAGLHGRWYALKE